MANPDTPMGFSAVSPLLSCQPYTVLAAYTTAIYKGDVLKAVTAGAVNIAEATSTEIIGATDDYSAASTLGTVMVWDSRFQQFAAQDDAGATPTQSIIHQNCDHVAGTGSATTLLSAHELAFASIDADTHSFRILDCIDKPDNVIGVNAIWRCFVNEHSHNNTTGVE